MRRIAAHSFGVIRILMTEAHSFGMIRTSKKEAHYSGVNRILNEENIILKHDQDTDDGKHIYLTKDAVDEQKIVSENPKKCQIDDRLP